ncbi:MAG: GAF domain-containing protein [Deltaproteobacteria bacterium]|nr:GAF domain-containing protein [Deltaproteobacteria bacterium]
MAAVMASADARLGLLYELSCAFSAKTPLPELIRLVMAKCREVLEAAGASILLLDVEKGELYFPYVAETDPEAAARLEGQRIPVDRGLGGAVVRTGEPLHVSDAPSDPRFYAGVDRETGVITGPMLAAPLRTRQGVVGVLSAVRRRGDADFGPDDLALLVAMAAGVAVAIENARLYEELRSREEGLRAEIGVYRRDAVRREGFGGLVGGAPAMREVFSLMESAAASPITVLIEGETGTGKELVARAIHGASPRATGPFVAVNCAALPESLLESELFGHRRGSFTGATQDRKGLFEAAVGGTIFLDEIGEMPLTMQTKILRVLQESEIVPIGETQPRAVDVRVISATNRNLEVEVDEGRMRADLFYRLSGFPIRVPPLSERREDIARFVAHFLPRAADQHSRRIDGIETEALERLVEAPWPGNVRQLQNEIERAVALAREGETIGMRHLSRRLQDGSGNAASSDGPAAAVTGPRDLRSARAEFEARHIAAVLREHSGNVSRAAASLGLSRSMLQRKIKEYGLRS